jgi:peptidoglycan-associated lipoprotein
MRNASKSRVLMAVLGVATVTLTTGCYAKKKDVQAEFTRVRQEMASGDAANTAAITETNTRVSTLTTRVDGIERDVQQLRTELADLNVKVTRLNGLIAFDVPVHFDFNKADLRDGDRDVLKKFASVVNEFYPGALITTEGYTDPAGSSSYNLRLGKQRADAVRNYLTSDGGLRTDKVRSVSYGESVNRLVDKNAKGPGDRGMENRRVVIVLDYVGTAAGIAAPVITH